MSRICVRPLPPPLSQPLSHRPASAATMAYRYQRPGGFALLTSCMGISGSMQLQNSEGTADRELEAFENVAVLAPGLAAIADRQGVAEAEQAERREPLHADADRRAQLVQGEAVVRRLAGLVEEPGVAEI